MNSINSFLLSILLAVAVTAYPNTDCECSRDEFDDLKKAVVYLSDSLRLLGSTVNNAHGGTLCSVGIKDGRVRNEQMTASSQWDARYSAANGRLNARTYWHAAIYHNRRGEWIQVDLQSPTSVVGIVTQGRHDATNQWTSSYKILYGDSTSNLQAIRDSHGNEMVFQGNTNPSSPVTNRFPRPITARYFRLVVETFSSYPVIRMEYLTC